MPGKRTGEGGEKGFKWTVKKLSLGERVASYWGGGRGRFTGEVKNIGNGIQKKQRSKGENGPCCGLFNDAKKSSRMSKREKPKTNN